jgi:hypothetical protein
MLSRRELVAGLLMCGCNVIPSKIVFIGTSITLGVRPGVVETDTFAYKVASARGFTEYLNKGVGMNTSAQMLARFHADVIEQNPTNVCIEIPHITDYYHGPIQPPRTESNVRSMVQMAQMANIRVTLITHLLTRDAAMIAAMQPRREVSWRLQGIPDVAFADCYHDFVWANFTMPGAAFDALYAVDGNGAIDVQHPSALGQARMASVILANPAACSIA